MSPGLCWDPQGICHKLSSGPFSAQFLKVSLYSLDTCCSEPAGWVFYPLIPEVNPSVTQACLHLWDFRFLLAHLEPLEHSTGLRLIGTFFLLQAAFATLRTYSVHS